jgi:hypothetical protein
VGSKTTKFSDLTGADAPEDKLGKLVVRRHPELDSPVYLEALAEEVTGLGKANLDVVMVEWQPPGEDDPKSFILSVTSMLWPKVPAWATFSPMLHPPGTSVALRPERASTTPRWSTPGGRTRAGLARRRRHLSAST